jgi:hypothetical protein
MSGVVPRVSATMQEPQGVAMRAATERVTTPHQPEKADVTYRRDSCEGQTTAGKA